MIDENFGGRVKSVDAGFRTSISGGFLPQKTEVPMPAGPRLRETVGAMTRLCFFQANAYPTYGVTSSKATSIKRCLQPSRNNLCNKWEPQYSI
jgi:hypothetical protein